MKIPKPPTIFSLVLFAAALVLAFGVSAQADTPESTPSVDETTVSPTESLPAPSRLATMRVVIDAETGRLRAPTPEESAIFATRGLPSRDIESLRVEKAADGTMTVRLGGAFMKAALAEVTAEGDVVVHHDVVPAVAAPETSHDDALSTAAATAETEEEDQ